MSSRWRRWVGSLEFDPEAASSSCFGLDTHTAVHALDKFADDGQAYPGAFVPRLNFLKHIKDAVLPLRWDADAIVLDPNADGRIGVSGPGVVGRFRPNAHPRGSAGSDEFDGIAKEIGKALSETGLIAQDDRERPFNVNFGPGRLKVGVGGNDTGHQLKEINGPKRQLVEHGAVVA